jgi:hypothetical protein
MSIDEFDDEGGAPECPYCSSADDCAHLLLFVDMTFRVAEGGALFKAFNDRWSLLCEQREDDNDFDERESFEDLLSEVDSYADASADYDQEGGPGMSSSYSIYYVDSAEKAKDVVTRFVSGGSV